MKLIFITATFSIIWYMRKHRVVSPTYSKEEDTFKIVYLIAPAALLALLVNHELSLMEVRRLRWTARVLRSADQNMTQVLWTFSIYLEAVAILPQLARVLVAWLACWC